MQIKNLNSENYQINIVIFNENVVKADNGIDNVTEKGQIFENFKDTNIVIVVKGIMNEGWVIENVNVTVQNVIGSKNNKTIDFGRIKDIANTKSALIIYLFYNLYKRIWKDTRGVEVNYENTLCVVRNFIREAIWID